MNIHSILLSPENLQSQEGKGRLARLINKYLSYIHLPQPQAATQGDKTDNEIVQMPPDRALEKIATILGFINQLPYLYENEEYYLMLSRGIIAPLLELNQLLKSGSNRMGMAEGENLVTGELLEDLESNTAEVFLELDNLFGKIKSSAREQEKHSLYTKTVLLEASIYRLTRKHKLFRFLKKEFDILKLTDITSTSLFATLLYDLCVAAMLDGLKEEADYYIEVLDKITEDNKNTQVLAVDIIRLKNEFHQTREEAIESVDIDDIN